MVHKLDNLFRGLFNYYRAGLALASRFIVVISRKTKLFTQSIGSRKFRNLTWIFSVFLCDVNVPCES